MGSLHFIALHTTVAPVVTVLSNSARMSILFEPEMSLAVRVMVINKFCRALKRFEEHLNTFLLLQRPGDILFEDCHLTSSSGSN